MFYVIITLMMVFFEGSFVQVAQIQFTVPITAAPYTGLYIEKTINSE